MERLDLLTHCQICDCTRQLYALRAVPGARRLIDPRHRRLNQALHCILQLAELPDLSRPHIGITNNVRTVTGKSLA
jgi:hypothetical protein